MKKYTAVALCLFPILSGCASSIEGWMHHENGQSYERGEISSLEYGDRERAVDDYFDE